MKAIVSGGKKILGLGLFVICLLALSTPARASVNVNQNSINFGSVAVGTKSASSYVTLNNTGSWYVKFSGASVSSTQFSYWGPTGWFTLKPYQSLKVAVSFRPRAAQAYSGTLTFVRSNGAKITVSLAGTGTGSGSTTQAPAITSQPASRNVTAGQAASFSVSASGTSPFAYQWNKNGAAIRGANSSSYMTPATAMSDSGAKFTCVVGNSMGSVTSNAATLTVSAAAVAPSITSQPANRTITAGQTATFSVTAAGTSPFTYQWNKNGAAISGATAASYITPAAATSDSGAQFTVVVGNSAGSVASSAAVLTVNAASIAPSITTQPASRTVTVGQTASFAVSVSGTSPFTYQWNKNGTAISGATSSTYVTPATAISDSGAQFTVVVTNAAGSVTSNAAALTVNAGTLLLTVNPTSLSFGNVNLSASATKSATITNSGTASVTLSGVSYSGAGFTMSGLSSGLILSPGQTATLNVTFSPTAAGSVTGSIAIASNATNSPASLAISGSGVQLITHNATLSWIPSTSTVAGYQVYSSTVSGGPYTKLTTSTVSLSSYTDSTVQSGKTYYYVVTAVNSSSVESTYSNQVTAVIP